MSVLVQSGVSKLIRVKMADTDFFCNMKYHLSLPDTTQG